MEPNVNKNKGLVTEAMDSEPTICVQLPSPPPYFTPDQSQTESGVKSYHIHPPFSQIPPPPGFSLSPGGGSFAETTLQSSLQGSSLPASAKFVSYEGKLLRESGLAPCLACKTQVNTQITHCVGRHAWLMCFVFIICGGLWGCCLIPFFVNHFKDVYHTCPRCQRVLHIHRATCCS